MKVCAPFVYNIAMGLATSVPQVYAERMVKDDAVFYGPLKRRCGQHVRKLRGTDINEGASLFSKTVLSRHVGVSRDGKVIRRTMGRPPLKIPRSKSMNDLSVALNES